MKTVLQSSIHILAVVSLYIIMTVGFGWFWKIGVCENSEKINNVLINLSYSFLTGYLVFVGTVLFPAKCRSKKIRYIVAERLRSISDNRLNPCLRIFVPMQNYNDSFSDQDYIRLYENENILGQSFFSSMVNNNKTVLEVLCIYCDSIKQGVNEIIKDYGQDLSVDLLKWLEEIKKDNVFKTVKGYSYLVRIRQKQDLQRGTITREENKILATEFIELKSKILNKIKELS